MSTTARAVLFTTVFIAVITFTVPNFLYLLSDKSPLKIIDKDYKNNITFNYGGITKSVSGIQNTIYQGTNLRLASRFNSEKYIKAYSQKCEQNGQATNKSVQTGSMQKPRGDGWMKRFPQCICIGQAKAGTRATLEYLQLHPNIAAAMREIKFFVDNSLYKQGFSAYLDHMPCSSKDQMTMEKSPEYIQWRKKETPQRIYKFDPSIQLLFAVRNPVDRAVSEYLHFWVLQGRGHGKSFEELATSPNGQLDTSYPPISGSLYDELLQPWLDVFKREQIHLIDGDNLISHPMDEMRKIETFLRLPPFYTNATFHFNSEKGFYCFVSTGKEKCLGKDKGNKHPALEKSFLEKLKAYYNPHNERFYKMIGQRFSWN